MCAFVLWGDHGLLRVRALICPSHNTHLRVSVRKSLGCRCTPRERNELRGRVLDGTCKGKVADEPAAEKGRGKTLLQRGAEKGDINVGTRT